MLRGRQAPVHQVCVHGGACAGRAAERADSRSRRSLLGHRLRMAGVGWTGGRAACALRRRQTGSCCCCLLRMPVLPARLRLAGSRTGRSSRPARTVAPAGPAWVRISDSMNEADVQRNSEFLASTSVARLAPVHAAWGPLGPNQGRPCKTGTRICHSSEKPQSLCRRSHEQQRCAPSGPRFTLLLERTCQPGTPAASAASRSPSGESADRLQHVRHWVNHSATWPAATQVTLTWRPRFTPLPAQHLEGVCQPGVGGEAVAAGGDAHCAVKAWPWPGLQCIGRRADTKGGWV